MDAEFEGLIWYWKGPAPFYWVTVPPEISDAIRAMSSMVTYGWGVIPATIWIGKTRWTTSLFPKDGLYIVPLKVAVRRAEKLEEGQRVTVRIEIG